MGIHLKITAAGNRGLDRALLIAVISLASIATGCAGAASSNRSNNGGTDTVPPSIASVSASPSSATAAISWTTNEPADSQVEYGATSSYGQASPISATLVISHSASLSGLASSTPYHFRVKSKDAAGNLSASADFTFQTTAPPDTTAPSVSVSAPSSGATVSGTTTVSANASDNVGVAGVQFRLDGANLGAEDTTSPFSTSWNTASSANGSHSLTAIARDAAGNMTTSATVSVTVNNPVPDTTPPTVSISAPAAGATVSSTLTVTASASDNVGVAGVQFRLDGANLGAEDTTSPFSTSWNTASSANGSHSLTAVARDAAGNTTTSAAVSVTVNNSPPPPGSPITVGQVVVDPPTLVTIGVSLPILSGDTNYNATVLVSYRKTGDTVWKSALPLMRVRPDKLSTEDPTPFAVGEQFAGSIFDLDPDTSYEVKLDVQDPDGGNTTQTVSVQTRPVPLANPAAPRAVPVSTMSQLTAAVNAANPGDVITLANGTYTGSITVSRSGTLANPIFIRGQSRDGVILDATGTSYGVTLSGANITVENFTIRNSNSGMRLSTTSNLVIRQLHIAGVFYGMNAIGGTNRNYYICDNLLEGKGAVWPDTSSAVWDFEGIVVTGTGHVVCYNTISGFGDALGLHHTTSIPNRAIDFYGNEVLWTGDNGIELDFTERNVRAFRNRFTNGGIHPISFQPIWGGPAYAIRNVVYNSATAPYKLNNDPTGFYILHNTTVRPGIAWGQYAGRADNFVYENNIAIGTTDAVDMTTVIGLAQIDYDGWLPDGTFKFTTVWNNFADLQANSPYEHHGLLLNGMPFAIPFAIPSIYTAFVQPLDATLAPGSNAIDAGIILPNINDGFTGTKPDLGALERGLPPPTYGVRPPTP